MSLIDRSLFDVEMSSVASNDASQHNIYMSSDVPNLVDAALNLSDSERASLAYRLLQSLKPPKVLSDGDSGFESELERRVEEYDAGRTTASDWDDVASRLQTKLKERKSS